jgi:hypothetical protein
LPCNTHGHCVNDAVRHLAPLSSVELSLLQTPLKKNKRKEREINQGKRASVGLEACCGKGYSKAFGELLYITGGATRSRRYSSARAHGGCRSPAAPSHCRSKGPDTTRVRFRVCKWEPGAVTLASRWRGFKVPKHHPPPPRPPLWSQASLIILLARPAHVIITPSAVQMRILMMGLTDSRDSRDVLHTSQCHKRPTAIISIS